MTHIIWFSRHPCTASQVLELRRLFGDIKITQHDKKFSSVAEIIETFHRLKGDEMVLVAPLTVVKLLCEQGYKPLLAKMEECHKDVAETHSSGRYYRFIEFQRVHGVNVKTSEVI